MALADAADRRIAAHLPQRLDVVREQQRLLAHTRGSERGLGACVTTADHDDVECFAETHQAESTGFFPGGAYFKPGVDKSPLLDTPTGGYIAGTYAAVSN